MPDTVAEIKNRLDTLEFFKGYLKLIPAGRSWKALCPFHKEKTPSFSISPDRGSWYCFGCSQGGDVFKFLMQFENIEFFDALKILAEKTGVHLDASSGVHDTYKPLYELNRLAKDFYCTQLQQLGAFAAAARQYLEDRGLTKETIQEFEIGLATTNGDSLFRHLVSQKKSVQEIEKAGLILRSERGTYFDRFRSRIMFPLYNQFGKIVGFTGRILPIHGVQTENVGKYVNSPETPIFNKSKLLYGLDKAKNAIRDEGYAIVVEGQMDLIMMWQDEIRNVVASSGTALTVDHLAALRRLTDTVIFSFDTDAAGLAAAERSIDLAAAQDFNIKILHTGEYKDPADVVKAVPGLMKQYITEAKQAMEFYYTRYPINDVDRNVQKKNIRALLGKIKNSASAIDRSKNVSELARRTGLPEAVLMEEMQALPKTESASSKEATVITPIEERHETRKEKILSRMNIIALGHPELDSERETVELYCTEEERSWITKKSEELTARAGLESEKPIEEAKKEYKKLLNELKREYLKNRREELRLQIASSEREGNEEKLHEFLKEFDGVLHELHNVP